MAALWVFCFYGTSARFRAMASPISFLQNSLFLAAALHVCICSKSTASLQTAFSHLLLRFPSCLLPPEHTLFFDTGSSIFTLWLAHYILFRCEQADSATPSYNLYISSRYLTPHTPLSCAGSNILLYGYYGY